MLAKRSSELYALTITPLSQKKNLLLSVNPCKHLCLSYNTSYIYIIFTNSVNENKSQVYITGRKFLFLGPHININIRIHSWVKYVNREIIRANMTRQCNQFCACVFICMEYVKIIPSYHHHAENETLSPEPNCPKCGNSLNRDLIKWCSACFVNLKWATSGAKIPTIGE